TDESGETARNSRSRWLRSSSITERAKSRLPPCDSSRLKSDVMHSSHRSAPSMLSYPQDGQIIFDFQLSIADWNASARFQLAIGNRKSTMSLLHDPHIAAINQFLQAARS